MGNGMDKIRSKGNKPFRLLIQGLGSVGKTTILYRLKLGEVVETMHTIDQNCENIEHNNKQISIWDIGPGRDKTRVMYRFYYRYTDALVFVIDSSDRENFAEVKEELERTMGEDELKKCPFVILANKQDLPDAMGKEEMIEKLHLQNSKAARGKRWAIFPTSAITGEGFSDALDWLTNQQGLKHSDVAKDTGKSEVDIAFFKKAVQRMRSILFD